MNSIINTLNEIRQLYSSRGFRAENIHADNEFDKEEIKRSQLPILFHIYGKDEHVGLIERSNRTIKNKARTMVHAVSYKFIPKLMVRVLVAEAVDECFSKYEWYIEDDESCDHSARFTETEHEIQKGLFLDHMLWYMRVLIISYKQGACRQSH